MDQEEQVRDYLLGFLRNEVKKTEAEINRMNLLVNELQKRLRANIDNVRSREAAIDAFLRVVQPIPVMPPTGCEFWLPRKNILSEFHSNVIEKFAEKATVTNANFGYRIRFRALGAGPVIYNNDHHVDKPTRFAAGDLLDFVGTNPNPYSVQVGGEITINMESFPKVDSHWRGLTMAKNYDTDSNDDTVINYSGELVTENYTDRLASITWLPIIGTVVSIQPCCRANVSQLNVVVALDEMWAEIIPEVKSAVKRQ